jgi:dihydrofolate synthase/folylpolyglutamate synthase
LSESNETLAYWAKRATEVEESLLTRIPENKVRPRLQPTRRAVELLGDPQKSYRVIHVTGTNGKTSTTRFIERILREHGLRTGRFTSPHLVKLGERMALDGEAVSDERLSLVWQDIAPVLEIVDAELLEAGETRLTFFEALAVLGFSVFADAMIDVLVLEVGMGGEWDSTNVADGDVAVFTPIDLDHMERLGNTIEEIAKTKSGIIKPNAIVVSASQQPQALAVLQNKSQSLADKFVQYEQDFGVLLAEPEARGQRISLRGLASEYRDLFLPVHGWYQAENAALAVAAVESFLGGGNLAINEHILRSALADATSPGRLQVIASNPRIILDAAHNPNGAESLSRALRETFGSPFAVGVISILSEKDAANFFKSVDQVFDSVVVTQSSSPRAIDAEQLAAIAVSHLGEDRVHVEANPITAIEVAKSMLPASDAATIVVAGSISLIGDVLKEIQEHEDLKLESDEKNEK